MLVSGSLLEAATGCQYIIHAAGPMLMQVPKGKVHEALVTPYVKGTENILASATAAGIKKVVYTSGVAAVAAGHTEFGPDHVITEDDWNVKSSPSYMPLN